LFGSLARKIRTRLHRIWIFRETVESRIAT